MVNRRFLKLFESRKSNPGEVRGSGGGVAARRIIRSVSFGLPYLSLVNQRFYL